MANLVLVVLGIAIAVYIFIRLIILFTNIRPEIYKEESTYKDHSWKPEKAFFSKNFLLTGKPDMLIKNKDGTIPLEVKSRAMPNEPFANHVMQLASYCLLLQEQGNRPPYGLIQYSNGKPFKIQFTDELRRELIQVIMNMRKSMNTNELNDGGFDYCHKCENV